MVAAVALETTRRVGAGGVGVLTPTSSTIAETNFGPMYTPSLATTLTAETNCTALDA